MRSKVLKSRQKTRKETQPPSPTPSEAGRAQVTSCSSSETDDFSHCTKNNATTTTTATTSTTTTTTHPETQTHLLNTLKEQNEYEQEPHVTDQEQEHDDTLTTITTIEHDNDHDLQHSDIEIEEITLLEENVTSCSNSFKRQFSTSAEQQKMSEKECIEQIIRNELNRTPRHKLMKSQSTIEQRVTTDDSLKRMQQKQQAYAGNNEDVTMNGTAAVVIRSGSVNGNLANRFQQTQQQQLNSNLIHCNNSWRRSNGWKRVTTSPLHSPKKVFT